MAHVNCHGTWIKSKLGPDADGTGEFAGVFVIDEHDTNRIVGTHKGRNDAVIVGRCDGDKMRFAITDKVTGDVICYLKGEISPGTGKFFINGKFKKPLDDDVFDRDAADTETIWEGKRLRVAPDDWTAEKPT
jgi:hypothetical protein